MHHIEDGLHYTVAQAIDLVAFEREVSSMMACGWRPCGGVSTVTQCEAGTSIASWYIQAMTLHTPDAHAPALRDRQPSLHRALVHLRNVCVRMESADQLARPTQEQFRAAIQQATEALY